MAKIPCRGKTASGAPCNAPAGPNGLCYLHANPDRAKQLGQMGGLGNRRSAGIDLEVLENMSLADLRNLEEQTIRRFVSGELKARDVPPLVQLFNSLLRIIPNIDLEARLATLEKEFGSRKSKFVSQHNSTASPTHEMAVPQDPGEQSLELDADSPAVCPSASDPQSERDGKSIKPDERRKP